MYKFSTRLSRCKYHVFLNVTGNAKILATTNTN